LYSPTSAEEEKARRHAISEVRRRVPTVAVDAEDIVADAMVTALRVFRGDAELATLVVKIAVRAARKQSIRATNRAAAVPRSLDAPLNHPAYGKVFTDFYRHTRGLVAAHIFPSTHRAKLPSVLLTQLRSYLPHLCRGEGAPELPRLSEDFDSDGFGVKVLRHVAKICSLGGEGWVESLDTLRVRPPTVGRSRRDPYATKSKRLSVELEKMRQRNPAAIFRGKRQDVVDAVISHALKLVGIPGTFVKKTLRALERAAQRSEERDRRALVAIVRASRAKKSSNSE
jgi:hypothetical protein